MSWDYMSSTGECFDIGNTTAQALRRYLDDRNPYDADTTAAICGQLAGAYYGVQDIPSAWIDKLAMSDDIVALADRLLAERHKVSSLSSQ